MGKPNKDIIQSFVEETTDENVTIFDNYETAFIGLTIDDRAVYDYDKMVDYLVENDKMTEEEAIEWIEYNTVRSLPYYENSPIIIRSLKCGS